MSTRLNQTLQRYPEHEEGLRLLASRDPSQNLKYLDWSARVLAAGQALAPEIADVVELFHEFKGRPFVQGKRRERIHPDVYSYRTQDFAKLRDDLRRLKRAKERKRRARERLYHIDGTIEADVVYDSDDLVVRHIKNKDASAHYGLSTKWCIAMRREHYFEDYETQNATFFFFERKTPLEDEYDKVALVISRDKSREYDATESAYTSLDRRIGLLDMAGVYGERIFEILRTVYMRSLAHPHSAMFLTHRGTASAEQLAAVFEKISEMPPHEVRHTLEAICCNDEAPFELLKKIETHVRALVFASWQRQQGRRRHRPRSRTFNKKRSLAAAKEAERNVRAALAIHPAVPDAERAVIVKALRRSHVNTNTIRRSDSHDMVGVEYATPWGKNLRARRYRRRRPHTARAFTKLAEMMDRRAAKYRKKAKRLALAAAKKAKAAR